MSKGNRRIAVAVAAAALAPVPACVPSVPPVQASVSPAAPEVLSPEPVITTDPVIDEPDVVLSFADRENPGKLSGPALRRLAHDRGIAFSESERMTDAQVRQQLEYVYHGLYGLT